MILNNYYKYLKATCDQHYIAGSGNYDIQTYCQDMDGTQNIAIMAGSQGADYSFGANFNIRENIHAVVGTGDTEPTSSDYALDTPISLSSYTENISYSADDNGFKTTIVISGINNTSSSITIKEIGTYKRVYNSSGYLIQNILFTRTLLDTPITVPAYGNVSLIFEWIEA